MICDRMDCFARDSGLGPIENCDKKCTRRIFDKSKQSKVKHIMVHQKPKDSIEDKLDKILEKQDEILNKLTLLEL